MKLRERIFGKKEYIQCPECSKNIDIHNAYKYWIWWKPLKDNRRIELIDAMFHCECGKPFPKVLGGNIRRWKGTRWEYEKIWGKAPVVRGDTVINIKDW